MQHLIFSMLLLPMPVRCVEQHVVHDILDAVIHFSQTRQDEVIKKNKDENRFKAAYLMF